MAVLVNVVVLLHERRLGAYTWTTYTGICLQDSTLYIISRLLGNKERPLRCLPTGIVRISFMTPMNSARL